MITATAILVPTVLLCVYCYRKAALQERNSQADKVEPPSLLPIIDNDLCGGCGSCVEACPEGEVLGLLNGKAALIQPAKCLSHGACRDICPLEAITL